MFIKHKYDVVCATLIDNGLPLLEKICPRFPIVLIDECTQATEPRCCIALSKASHAVVLVGDQQQLPPTCVSREAEQQGLGVSLFERIIGFGDCCPKTMLTVQHRMHPLIHRFPSDQFYDGHLVGGPSALGCVPPVIM